MRPSRPLHSSYVVLILLSVLLWFCPAFPALAGAPPSGAKLVKVSILDVGQGDSIVIQTPSGKTVLIDTGPGTSRELLLDQLEQLHISEINLAIATHAHEDHIGGYTAVMDRYPVKLFTDPDVVHTSQTYKDLLLKLKEKEIPVRTARKGQKYKLDDDLQLEVLAPREPLLNGTNSDINNSSAVTRLTYGKFSMLFPGDAEKETEERLLEDGIPQTAALKAGHHGSHSSSSLPFIQRLAPQIAVISCETDNRYGHPHQETLDTYTNAHIHVYRTDQDGQVQVLSDGQQIWVETFSRASLVAAAGEGAPTPGDSATRIPLPDKLEPTRIDGPFPIVQVSGAGLAPDGAEETTATEGAKAKDGAGEVAPSEGGYVASKSSKVFHKAFCANGKRISEANLVHFATRQEAIDKGKQPAKCCNP